MGRLGAPAAAAAAQPAYKPTVEEERNDYTVLPIDLSRRALWLAGWLAGCAAATLRVRRPAACAHIPGPGWRSAVAASVLYLCYIWASRLTARGCLLLRCRYAATAGNEGDTIPLNFGPAPRRSALPTEFARQLAGAGWREMLVCGQASLPQA